MRHTNPEEGILQDKINKLKSDLRKLAPATIAVALTDKQEYERVNRIFENVGIGVVKLRAGAIRQTIAEENPQVIICEKNIADPTLPRWREVLEISDLFDSRPNVIVSSRQAGLHLWAEVLNLRGHDVLLQPFELFELLKTVELAIHSSRKVAAVR